MKRAKLFEASLLATPGNPQRHYVPPSQAFLIFSLIAERAIGRLGVNKRARAGAGSE